MYVHPLKSPFWSLKSSNVEAISSAQVTPVDCGKHQTKGEKKINTISVGFRKECVFMVEASFH
jgi:hypothetical protein